jgi:hypothetical protein
MNFYATQLATLNDLDAPNSGLDAPGLGNSRSDRPLDFVNLHLTSVFNIVRPLHSVVVNQGSAHTSIMTAASQDPVCLVRGSISEPIPLSPAKSANPSQTSMNSSTYPRSSVQDKRSPPSQPQNVSAGKAQTKRRPQHVPERSSSWMEPLVGEQRGKR